MFFEGTTVRSDIAVFSRFGYMLCKLRPVKPIWKDINLS